MKLTLEDCHFQIFYSDQDSAWRCRCDTLALTVLGSDPNQALSTALFEASLNLDTLADAHKLLIKPRRISFSLTSKKDARWDFFGEYEGLISDGMPDVVTRKITVLERHLGPRPDDLIFNCTKI